MGLGLRRADYSIYVVCLFTELLENSVCQAVGYLLLQGVVAPHLGRFRDIAIRIGVAWCHGAMSECNGTLLFAIA